MQDGSRSNISYVGRANRNLKDRLVLRYGQETDKLNICMNRLGLVKLPYRRAAAVSTVDLFLGVLSDPALPRSGGVLEFEFS